MKHTRWIPALLALALILTMAGNCSAETADETVAEEAPGTDAAVDEALPGDEAPADEDGAQAGEEPADEDNPGVRIPFALTLDQTTVGLDYSQRVTLTASASIGAGSIQWACSDENVATISRTTGDSVIVTALNEGTATVSCSLGGATQSCEVTVRSPRTLQITGVDYPATLVRGKSWTLQGGTVASPDNITEVSSVIRDVNGVEMVPSYYAMPMDADVKRFEISGIDAHVPFSRIPEDGGYVWTLSATDESGRTVSLDLPIDVVSDGETVVATEPGAYAADDTAAAPQEDTPAATDEDQAPQEDTPAATGAGQPAARPPVEAGVNLLRGTGSPSVMNPTGGSGAGEWPQGTWGLTSYGDGRAAIIDVSDCPAGGVTKGFSIIGNTDGNRDISQYHVPYVPGQTYTISLYARVPSGTAKLYVRAWDVTNGAVNTVIIEQDISNTAWERYTGTFTFDGDASNVSAQFGLTGPGSIDVCGFKLETGDTATDWTAAPEDAYATNSAVVTGINVPAEGWVADAENQNLCHIDIPLPGISPASRNACIVSLVQTGDEAADAPAREAYGLLTRGVVGEGMVTLCALRPPTSPFALRLVLVATDVPVTELIGLGAGF